MTYIQLGHQPYYTKSYNIYKLIMNAVCLSQESTIISCKQSTRRWGAHWFSLTCGLPSTPLTIVITRFNLEIKSCIVISYLNFNLIIIVIILILVSVCSNHMCCAILPRAHWAIRPSTEWGQCWWECSVSVWGGLWGGRGPTDYTVYCGKELDWGTCQV